MTDRSVEFNRHRRCLHGIACRMLGSKADAEDIYTPRERAALAWTEALTCVADGYVPDAVFEHARQHFEERELVDLALAVATINGWNRLCIAFRAEAGTCQPAKRSAAQAA
jgi:alkylhydroperoxidase family enzyme